MQLTKCISVALLMLALFGSSCKSQKQVIEKETQIDHRLTEQEIQRIEKEVKMVTTPQTIAKVTLSEKELIDLPLGASYQAKDRNATGTIRKTDKGIEFTANCDSLNLLVEQLTKEVYRYRSDSTALVTKQNQQQTIEVNKLTRSQLFQIWGFRLLIAIAIIVIFKKFNIWQLVIKIIKKLL